MLAQNDNSNIYKEWANFIESDEVRMAFYLIVGIAACTTKFICNVQWKGDLRDFRFYDLDEKQVFSFSTNQHWLLFYFHSPTINSGKYSCDRLARDFESFNENPSGQWTIKLRNMRDIELLMQHVSFSLSDN